jgi:hypothetical protein
MVVEAAPPMLTVYEAFNPLRLADSGPFIEGARN